MARQIEIGEFDITEIRLKPEGLADVIVLANGEVTNAIRTHDFVDGVLGLANAQLEGNPVRLILEFEDPTND